MKTQCNSEALLFQTQTRRDVVAHFNGVNICSDGGGVLLRQTERVAGIIKKFAACFTDHRDADLIERLDDPEWQVRHAAADALEKISAGDQFSVPKVIEALLDSEWKKRQSAARALQKSLQEKMF